MRIMAAAVEKPTTIIHFKAAEFERRRGDARSKVGGGEAIIERQGEERS